MNNLRMFLHMCTYATLNALSAYLFQIGLFQIGHFSHYILLYILYKITHHGSTLYAVPLQVDGFTASSPTPTSITVSWNETNPTIQYYKVGAL